MKVIIIEDEINSQELLTNLLQTYCENIEILGVADSVDSSVELINSSRPDVVLMDVEIRGGTGFDVLDKVQYRNFKLIVTTGYDFYALKAIKFSAIDYLLKPINIEELQTAISKISPTRYDVESESIDYLKKNIHKPKEEIDSFVLPVHKKNRIVKFAEIVYIEAERTYSRLLLADGIKYMSSKALQHFEEMLNEQSFFRIHKSYLVNLKSIKVVHSGRGGEVELKEGVKLPIAYRRKSAFMKALKEQSILG